ncbi:1-aminocyclopropane-1-carboxylate deaminase [Sulfurimonas sp.]|uniref:1-aminocyclopropane-1-carboxylate deaminase n=1 Tax=Sulfurimonas sp. TaxID=2022749 RepID=UPI0025D93014|nr:1-aminocyclopropane-1-carboxylate deaminase [Sulfurimonas sp.]
MNPSPISKLSLEGRVFYVKRDDLIDPFLAGNKYRKLYTLLKTPSNKLNKIISYGGTQSNAMLAIAAMCKSKSWEFEYYTKPLSQTQKIHPYGNYYHSINLGMRHIEIDEVLYKDYIASLSFMIDASTFIVDQGGAVEEAKKGLEVLAEEIKAENLELRSLATPSGTGTTALFLALSLPEFKVYTTPCVGDVKYLKEQMQALSEIPKNLIILEPSKKHHFAKPYPEFLQIYKKVLASGIEFDLLYSPGMWEALLAQTDEEILYIHSGGVSGNESMLKKYEQKGFR